jgi:hypothetical protein
MIRLRTCVLAVSSLFALVARANAQFVRTATFENFTEGQSFGPSFTDPLSSESFREPTGPLKGFSIDSASGLFGGGMYLTSGGYSPGPGGGVFSTFGFKGDLPSLANRLSIDVSHLGGDTSQVSLTGFNSLGGVVSQSFGQADAQDPFRIQVTSNSFNFASFQVQVPPGLSAGYDNISFTIVPEPSIVATLGGIVAFFPRSRRFHRARRPVATPTPRG